MKRRYAPLLRFVLHASFLTALLYPADPPTEAQETWVARVVSVQGTVEAQRVGGTQWQPVQLNDTYSPGDTIRVQERSRADLTMLDQSVLRLNENTTLTLQAVKEERTGVIDLLRGAAHFFSRGSRSLEVETPFTTAGIRGTEFFISVEPDKTLLTIFAGTVVAENPSGSLTLTGGQSAVAEAGRAPVLRVVARPRDAVLWALYYPPVLYFRVDEFPPGPDWQGRVRQSIEFSLRGDLQKAFESIATVPGTVHDPRFFAYRATLLLAVGRVDEANADIERVLHLNPNDSNALALQTIIAVVQNERERALDIAQQAVAVAPHSATAWIALSYAQQARFDLEGARASLQRAVELEPHNALAWARLAELWSSFGELDQALGAAQQAVALEPNLSRTQTVLGFAYLTQVKTTQAKEAFEKALVLDQADPLPRLGLGLAQIREGDLHGGRREIEIAASLDPNDSIIRSYLGKAYFEEKRTNLDEREYAIAKELDPQDPTPWFYDAIAKQTTNRPVEALHDLQKAIELSDNRAVYRSRLLLDSDLAARSASLARVYSDLGFQQLALVEGWKSVNTDPSNFSAHRFLADSYSMLPRHEIARVSELLQSQLLQPLNMTPIQPQLAESNLFLLSAAGPSALSFNEFNPLFNRNGITAQTSGMVGENDTYAGEGILSGIHNNVAFSFGGLHFTTDGWRKNAHQKDDIANAFLQYELSPKTSVQAEYRYRNFESGDLKLNFLPNDFSRFFKDNLTTNTYRFGLRHALSPNSILLGSFIYQNRDQRGHDEPTPIAMIDVQRRNHTGMSNEIQHLFRSPYVNLTSGFGFFRVDGAENIHLELNLPPPPFGPGPQVIRESIDKDVNHFNVYLYSNISLLENVTLTLGGSGDFYDPESSSAEKRNQFNPKVGIVWNPFRDTTVRAAAFRVLRRTLITNQTLEPTQVAGFNQFFDDNDIEAVRSWRYGGAVDQKLPLNFYGGVEYSLRDMSVPFEDLTVDPAQIKRADWHEQLARAYLFWTPHSWLALRAAYQYEEFRREQEFTIFLRKLATHSVPLGVTFTHPSGFGALLQTTYYHQHGTVFPQGADDFVSGTSDFWLVDAGLSYRLPKRYGLITIGVRNLTDRKFRYQETDFKNPLIQPDRMVFFRATLAFP
jgi:tetratricopeptide (TPR) repeat protein